jgi:hypothetical protein
MSATCPHCHRPTILLRRKLYAVDAYPARCPACGGLSHVGTEHLTAFEPVARGALDRLHALGMHGNAAFAVIERTLVQQAYMLGTNDIFWLWGWLLLTLIALTWLTRAPFVAGRTAQAG